MDQQAVLAFAMAVACMRRRKRTGGVEVRGEGQGAATREAGGAAVQPILQLAL
jgi:hypothetical protein